jgi:hypothetical protein
LKPTNDDDSKEWMNGGDTGGAIQRDRREGDEGESNERCAP